MIVVNDTAVRAYGNIDTCFFVILITFLAYLDKRCSLTSADTLLFTGDTDRAAADTYLDKVCTAVSEETEAFAVHYVTCADLYAVAVAFSDPVDSELLPFGITLRAVDTKHVCTCFNKSRNTLCVVSCVDTCANYVTLVAV